MSESPNQKVADLRSELSAYGFSAPKTMKKKELLSKLTELREQAESQPAPDDTGSSTAFHSKRDPPSDASSPKNNHLNENAWEGEEKSPSASWDKQADSEKEFEPQSMQEIDLNLNAPPSEDALISAERIEHRANRFGTTNKTYSTSKPPNEPLSLDQLLSNHLFSHRKNSKHGRKQTADADIILERRLMRFGTSTPLGTVLTLEQIQREEEKLKKREERFGLPVTEKRRAPIN
ncbi:uncharacterized protein LOC126316796 [Schistocerca gregaria]|uniref:uncharacterized protein LOC126316796 n=1 Tax=Schistocerca gregaria TaxID=7010 RepID=UPI00211DBC81|nr:uncharacterized protein LOC126316796 [Schistocerca gregaria]